MKYNGKEIRNLVSYNKSLQEIHEEKREDKRNSDLIIKKTIFKSDAKVDDALINDRSFSEVADESRRIKTFSSRKRNFRIDINSKLEKNKGIVLEDDNHSIIMIPIINNNNKEVIAKRKYSARDEIVFTSFKDDDDLEYQIKDNGLKENITINHIKDSYEYDFELHLRNLELRIDDNKVTLVDSNSKELLYRFADLLMQDSDGKISTSIELQTQQISDDVWTLKLLPDSTWLNDETRQFPVKLDPTIESCQSSLVKMTWYSTNNTSYVRKADKDTVGIKDLDMNYVKIEVNLENIITKIKQEQATEYKCILQLAYSNGSRAISSPGFCLIDNVYSRLYLQSDLVEIDGKMQIDITSFIKQGIVTNNMSSLKMLLHLKNAGGSSQALSGSEIDLTKTDYIYLYHEEAEDEKHRPQITLEYSSKNDMLGEEKSYDVGKAGNSFINLKNLKFRHEIFDTTISHNSLSLDINHVYNSGNDNVGLGVGWKTNLHQRLIKDSSLNDILGSKDVKYIDGEGKEHLLHEQWFYTVNKIKHYIDKDLVYLDVDQKLKCKVNEKIYTVEYEVNNDEGLSFISASSLYNYKDKAKYTKKKRFYIRTCFGGDKLYLEEDKDKFGRYHFPIYTSSTSKTKITNLPKWINELYPNKKEVYELDVQDLFYCYKQGSGYAKDGKNLTYIKHLYGTITQTPGGQYQIRSLNKVYYGSSSNVDPLVESFDEGNGCLTMINVYCEDVVQENDVVEGDYFVTDEIKQVNSQIESLNDAMKEMRLNLRNSSFGITSTIDDIKLKELTRAMISESGSIESGSNKYLISHGIANSTEQKKLSIDSYALLEEKINDYEFQLTSLNEKKQTLINNQKKEANDFIIDKDGTMLGFNGYGKLVLIQDKYENEIRIVFDEKEDGDTNRITSVESDTQMVRFKYEDDLLISIKNPDGKLIKFKYDKTNKRLIEIQTAFKEVINISSSSLLFSVSNALYNTLKVDFSNSSNSIVTKVTRSIDKKRINNTGLVSGYTGKDTFTENYAKAGNVTTVTDKHDRPTKYVTDIQGRVIYSYDELNKTQSFKKYNNNNKLDFDIVCLDNQKMGITPIMNTSTITITRNGINNGIPSAGQILRSDLSDDNLMAFYLTLGNFNVVNLNIVRLIGTVVVSDDEDIAYTYTQTYDEVDQQTIAIPFAFDKKKVRRIEFTLESSVPLTATMISNTCLVPCTGKIIAYNSNDKIKEVIDGLNHSFYEEYEGEYPTKIRTISFGKENSTRYVYNADGRITYQEDDYGNCEETYYDNKGQIIEKRIYNKEDASLSRVERTSYDEQGKPTSIDGVLPNKDGIIPNTEYTYLPNSEIISKVKSPDGQITTYEYDFETGEILSVSSSAEGQNNATSYKYTRGLLTSLRHHGFGFEYEYDCYGRKTGVKVAGDSTNYLTVSYVDEYYSNALNINFGTYTKSEYKNGLVLESFNDERGLIRKSAIDNVITSYIYDDKDRLTQKAYDVSKEKTIYTYTEADNIASVLKTANNIEELKVENTYSSTRALNKQAITLNGDTKYYLCYDIDPNKNNQIKGVTLKSGTVASSNEGSEIEKVTYSYDALSRVTKQELYKNDIELLCSEYEYLKEGENTLDLIKNHHIKVKGKLEESLSYSYDVAGNIVKVITDEDETRYKYDKLNRLVREDNPKINRTITYKYDTAGNLLLKKNYPYSLDENLFSPTKDIFTYSCKGWKDQLVDYNGEKCIYDDMGRPTTYRDQPLVWNKVGTLYKYGAYEYTYNSDGIRTSKTVQGNIERFTLDGTKILRRKSNNVDLVFRYAIDKLIGFSYNRNEFIYRRNIQGDITHIYDINGVLKAQYIYDAYGNHVVLDASGNEDTNTNSIGNLNPFRYRGYYYDQETELYYLNSRYYDPEIGRFISPDTLSILDETRSQINGLNLYMYCGDNPIKYTDKYGNWFGIDDFIAFLTGAIINVTSTFISDLVSSVLTGNLSFSSWETYVGSFIGGGLGGLATLYMGPVAGMAIAAGTSTFIGGLLEMITGKLDLSDFGNLLLESYVSAGIGAVLGKVLGKVRIKIPRISSGSGSWLAVFNRVFSRLVHGTAKNMSTSVFIKGIISSVLSAELMYGFIDGMLNAIDITLKKMLYE